MAQNGGQKTKSVISPRTGIDPMVRRRPFRQRSINGGKESDGQIGEKADGGEDQSCPNVKPNDEPAGQEAAA